MTGGRLEGCSLAAGLASSTTGTTGAGASVGDVVVVSSWIVVADVVVVGDAVVVDGEEGERVNRDGFGLAGLD